VSIEFSRERSRRLLRASRAADQYPRIRGQPLLEPGRDALRLLPAFGREAALLVAYAVLGIGVTPQDEFHVL
jgi:hypothetical protein